MNKEINFGIGFIAGRPNVCRIINSYYDFLVNQVKDLNVKVNFTLFILFDLGYQYTTRTDFYSIIPKVYKDMSIKYITPEAIDEDKKKIMSKFNISQADVDLFIGKGYGKARNTILYYALKRDIDYLLFWDDDEYPLANVKTEKGLEWIKQCNVAEHIKNIEKADITYGYRCGMINPVPYIEYSDEVTEEDFKAFIQGLENEVVSWDIIKTRIKEDTLISYGDMDIATGQRKPEIVQNIGDKDFVLGSGICLNLKHLDKIPAFYNPPNARGEDTFFSFSLKEKGAKVLRIPTYHFHDCFLKYTGLMKERYPKTLRKIALDDSGIEQRFLKTTIGWAKYKPLYHYIMDRENYKNIIKEARINLEKSIPKINTAFETCDFTCLLRELDEYDKKVKTHYDEYIRTTEIWDKLKFDIKNSVENRRFYGKD